MSLNAKRELIASFRQEYKSADRMRKGEILDVIVASTECDRKHVIKMLKALPERKKRTRRRSYDENIQAVLSLIWQSAGCICAKRLVPFLPDFIPVLERHGHLSLSVEQRKKLLDISISTADRLLSSERKRLGRSLSTTIPANILRQQIPIRIFSDWHDDGIPGKCEADLVSHNGGNVNGRFAHTLTVTEVFIGWTECIAIDGKHHEAVINALTRIQEDLPFQILCLDTDNGTEFLNYDLALYCQQNHITFTRGRPYKKNDQAHVEQKNGAVVRRFVGYDRLVGKSAVGALNKLYEVCRLFVNFFQPSLKLDTKERVGGKVRKRYLPAKTPYQRLLDANITDSQRRALRAQFESLDPIELLHRISLLQEEVGEQEVSETQTGAVPSISTLTKVEHQSHLKRKYKKRGRKRLLSIELTERVHNWLAEDPSLNGLQIMCKLNSVHPGLFGGNQRVTFDRIVREWRSQHPQHAARFGAMYAAKQPKSTKSSVSS